MAEAAIRKVEWPLSKQERDTLIRALGVNIKSLERQSVRAMLPAVVEATDAELVQVRALRARLLLVA
jgi:hypothetical protein